MQEQKPGSKKWHKSSQNSKEQELILTTCSSNKEPNPSVFCYTKQNAQVDFMQSTISVVLNI